MTAGCFGALPVRLSTRSVYTLSLFIFCTDVSFDMRIRLRSVIITLCSFMLFNNNNSMMLDVYALLFRT